MSMTTAPTWKLRSSMLVEARRLDEACAAANEPATTVTPTTTLPSVSGLRAVSARPSYTTFNLLLNRCEAQKLLIDVWGYDLRGPFELMEEKGLAGEAQPVGSPDAPRSGGVSF